MPNGQRLFLAQSYGIHTACRRGDHGRRATDILLWLARRLDRSRQSSRDDRGPRTDACRFREPDDRHPALAVTSTATETDALNAILPRLPETIWRLFAQRIGLWGWPRPRQQQPPSRGLIFGGALGGGACVERAKLSCI